MFYRLTGKSIYIIRANNKEEALKDFNDYRVTGEWESIDDALAHVDGRFYSGYGSGCMYIKLSDKAYKLTRLGKDAIKLYDILCNLCLTSTEIEYYLTENEVPIVGTDKYDLAELCISKTRELGYRPLCAMVKGGQVHTLCLPMDSRGWGSVAKYVMANCYACLAIHMFGNFLPQVETVFVNDGDLVSPSEMVEYLSSDKSLHSYKESRRRLKFIGADTSVTVPVYNSYGKQVEPTDTDIQLIMEVYRKGQAPYCILHGVKKTAVLTVSRETAAWARSISDHPLGCKVMPAYVFDSNLNNTGYTDVLVWTDFGPTYVDMATAEVLYTLPKFVECDSGWNMRKQWSINSCYDGQTVYRTEDNKFYNTRDDELNFWKCLEVQ